MEFQQVVEKRRSVRSYNPSKKVTMEKIKKLIEAAILAPSWKNSQTARYYCILSEDKLNQFREECLPVFNAKNCKDASALIITAFVKNRAGFERETGEASNELGNGWGIYDLGLHNENLILKATDMGMDTLVMGIRAQEKIRSFLEIDESQIIVSVIAVGYAEVEPTKPKRKSVDDITKFY